VFLLFLDRQTLVSF